MRWVFVMVCFLTLARFQGAAQGMGGNDQLLFTVGTYPTYTEEFLYLYSKNQNESNVPVKASVNEYMELIVNFKLKIAESLSRGMDTTAAFRSEYVNYRDELRRSYSAGEDRASVLTAEAYERMKWEVRAAHILIRSKPEGAPVDTLAAYEKIADLRKKAIAGEDFLALAAEHSEDPSAQVNKGDLGYFSVLQMVYPFEEAAYSLEIGGVSPITKTQFGYHVIKLLDKRPSQGKVEVSHILMKGDDAQVSPKIHEVYQQVAKGASWDDMCRQYSDDESNKEEGGRLKVFSAGDLIGFPAFAQVAFGLEKPGDIAKPVKTSAGWHLIRLERKIPVTAFDEIEYSLSQRVRRDARFKLSEENTFANEKKQYGFSEQHAVKEQVLSLADTALLNGRWRFGGDQSLKDKKLFSLGQTPYVAGDFIRYILNRQDKGFQSPRTYMVHLYDAYVKEQIGDLGEAQLAATNVDFKHLLKEYNEGILLFEIMKTEVWEKASSDTLGLKKFYEQNKSNYMAGERVEARVLATTSRKALENVKEKILNGDTLQVEDMKPFSSVSKFRLYEKGDSKAVDAVNPVPGIYYPVIEKVFYIVEISRLIPPGIKLLEEARANVVTDYQKVLEKVWLEQLKKKFPVDVNARATKKIIRKLEDAAKSE